MPADAFSKTFARPALWLLLYGVLIAYGLYALVQMPVEVLPRFDYPQISIVFHRPGATPEEMETLVARPIEGRLLGLANLITVRSVMGQGTAQIEARFGSSTNAQQDLQAVYGAVDRARTDLPRGLEPHVEIMGNAVNEVADYAVEIPGNLDVATVQTAIESRIVPALRSLPGVQRVEVYGSGERALWIQPHLQALRRYGVSLAAIAQALRRQVVLGPAGHLVLGHQDVLVEARHLPTSAADLSSVMVDGAHGQVPLHDLARIVLSSVPVHHAAVLDGRSTVAMIVLKQPGASTGPVTEAVARTLATLKDQLPSGCTWLRTYNQGHLVGLIGSDLSRNLLVGGALAIMVLFAILGLHRGVWVLALSIPVALLTGIACLHLFGHTLNLLTLGALTVAVGLLADDAIIVMESIYHRWESGSGGMAGVRQGLLDILGPDITGTLTTVIVYLPLLAVGGLAALFFVPFALAMALALLASLLVSVTLVPVLLSRTHSRQQSRPPVGARLLLWLRGWNERLLARTLRFPRSALMITVALLAVSVVAVITVPMDFLPLPNEGVLLDGFSLPPGSSLNQTREAVDHISNALRRQPEVSHVFARIGSAAATAYTERSFAGEMEIMLKPGFAAHDLSAVAARLRRAARLQGVQQGFDTPTVERLGESLSGIPQPFVITVYGNRIPELRHISKQVTGRLKKVPALSGVFNNDAYPVTHLRISPHDNALASYGTTPSALYAQLMPALNGEVLARMPQGNTRLDLYLRLADAPYLGLGDLRAMPIRTDLGWTPLGQLAGLRFVTGPNQIRHINGERAVDILATPGVSLAHTIAAARDALKGLSLPPGYRVAFGGLFPRLQHMAIDLLLAAGGAVVLMVGILLVQFGSLRIPGILLLELPLAFAGGALALAISGVGLNATGLVGFLTVMGISLNHGIVLLHRAQRNEAAGMAPEAAVREAVSVRFRPIVLTTLTTVLGMLPTALGWGTGAEPEQGLAIVVLGGTLWSSVLSTNLIPALYLRWHPDVRRAAA